MDMFYDDLPITEVAPCVFHTKFLTPEYCKYIIQLCDAHNYWTTDLASYATCDIPFEIHFPDLVDSLQKAFVNRFRHGQLQEYLRSEFTDFYTIFAIKYQAGTQTSLALHSDDSYITASIKLNDDYEGGELNFPRQEYTNKDCEVGDVIVFPGSLSHPHECLELASGTKYSLTLWTKYPDIDYGDDEPDIDYGDAK